MTILDRTSHFIGETARPVAIISTSIAASVATVIIARQVENGNDGAIFIGAVLAGVATLYVGKAWEKVKAGSHARDVEVAQATGTTPGPQEVVVTNTHTDPVHVEETRP